MPYIIQRNDGAYVARQGNPSSYTRRLEDARIYRSKELAERDLCPGNEAIRETSKVWPMGAWEEN